MGKGGRGRRGGKGKKIEGNSPAVNNNTPAVNQTIPPVKTISKKKARAAAGKPDTSTPSKTPAAPATNRINGGAATKGKQEGKGEVEKSSGFIFMCSAKTKPECYIHRVFGLPAGKIDVVRKIKAGTKLFLYDFDLKILYGIYKAVSNGGRGLEPAAFGGKFPAQVRFKIMKDSLPLTEQEIRRAIPENYQAGSKFRPELSNKQVKKLMLLFKPVPISGSAPQQAPPVRDGYRESRLPRPEDAYAPRPHARGPPVREHPYVPTGVPPPQSSFYYPDSHQPYHSETSLLTAQDPYSRYRAAPEIVQRERLYDREKEYHRANLDRAEDYYLAPSAATRSHAPTYAPPPSYAPSSYAPPVSYAPASYAPATSYAPSYAAAEIHYPSVAHEDPSRAYADSFQRSAHYSTVAHEDSSRGYAVTAAGGNVPVSSLYAFAGPTSYR